MTDALQERGRAIWDAYRASELPAPQRALIQEAARLADTLDRLDGLLCGRLDSWVTLAPEFEGEVVVLVDKVLNERRQHALAFATLLRDIEKAGVAASGKAQKPQDEADLIDDLIGTDELALRRAARG